MITSSERLPLRAVVADDSALIRQGVVAVLTDAGFAVVGQAADASELVRVAERLEPDLVVTDIRMPPDQGADGLRAAALIRQQQPGIGIVVLSNHSETRHLSSLLDRGSGGVGYLLKERVVEVDEFVDAVERVAAGQTVLDPDVVSLLLSRKQQHQSLRSLTPREGEVLALIATGSSNAALSAVLHLSPKTVETHVQRIFTKLGLYEDPQENRRVKAVLAFLESRDEPAR